MPVILLAHRDSQLRASLSAALTARGFEVIGVDSIDAALDAAAAGVTALLVELQLLADEELEVKTRLDLRSGRPTRILVLTHKASAQEMSMLKRHGAGLLSRSVDDVERMAAMLRIQEEAPAPWEGSAAPPPPVARPASPSKPMVSAPKAQPSNIVPPPAPRPPPPPMMPPPPSPPAAATGSGASLPVAAPWDDSKEVAVEASPPAPAPMFKPAPAQFMPPDLSKSVVTSVTAEPPPPLPPPPHFAPPPTSAPGLRPAAPAAPGASALDDVPTTVGAPAPPPSLDVPTTVGMPAPPPPSFDDAATAIGVPFPTPPAPPVSEDGPLQVPADLFETPDIPAAPASAAKAAFTWGDDTEDELPRPPKVDTDVFRDEAEVPTNDVVVPGPSSTRPAPISPADAAALENEAASVAVGGKTAISPPAAAKPAPKVEVEAEPGSTGTFAIPDPASQRLSPATPPVLEERTQLIPELAATAIPARPSADPFAAPSPAPALPDIAGISATVSGAWFDDSAVNGIEKPAGAGPVVLVVEDEPAFRSFLKDALSGQGYRVHTAINGPNALRFVKATPHIDLVIADLHMPHMDGFELKHEIDQCLGRPMPFIVCTADANDEKIQVAAQVGAAALVPKPIENLDAFFAIVTDTLRDAGVIARTA